MYAGRSRFFARGSDVFAYRSDWEATVKIHCRYHAVYLLFVQNVGPTYLPNPPDRVNCILYEISQRQARLPMAPSERSAVVLFQHGGLRCFSMATCAVWSKE